MSPRYHEMISKFKQSLRDKGGWTIPEDLTDDPWMEFGNSNPTATEFSWRFCMEHGFDLSWGQCCNAVVQLAEEIEREKGTK